MVTVGVGAHNRSDAGVAYRAQYSLDMPFTPNVGRVTNALAASNGARIDDSHVAAAADNPCLRSSVGVRRRIGRKHAAHERLMLFGFTCFNCVGPVHPHDMAHNGQKKKGRLSITAPAGSSKGEHARSG